MMSIGLQIAWLLVLSIPIACVAWTVTHEEVFRESREYCFSHYVAALFLIITRFKLLYEDWRGYLVALFALVWVANQYMSIYNRLRLDIKHERIEIKAKEEEVEEKEAVEEKRAA